MPNNLIPVRIIQSNPPTDGSFIRKELPVVIKGGCLNWPAFSKWTVEFFSGIYGDIEVPVSNYRKDPYQPQNQKPVMKIRDYLDNALRIASGQTNENEDLYSAGWFFCNGHCELLKDVTVPEYFRENWADRVQKVIHFDTRSILFGHPKVESPLHTDSFFVSTYFAMIKGQKQMRLVAPEHGKHVQNGYNVFDSGKLLELESKGVPVYDCVIEEGDLIWFPPGWWHHVKNLSFTISMTTSFVSAYHFLPFEQQVRATLIKPLLKLAQVKDEALKAGTTPDHSEKCLSDAYFIRNEIQYVNYFQAELQKTEALLQHFQSPRQV